MRENEENIEMIREQLRELREKRKKCITFEYSNVFRAFDIEEIDNSKKVVFRKARFF